MGLDHKPRSIHERDIDGMSHAKSVDIATGREQHHPRLRAAEKKPTQARCQTRRQAERSQASSHAPLEGALPNCRTSRHAATSNGATQVVGINQRYHAARRAPPQPTFQAARRP